MAPALKEGLQYTPAPSKFAHLKNTEPSTTSSGVIPGQAAFDTPPPDRSPSPELERSQRSRRPTTKKLESSQQQAGSSKSKSKSAKATNGNGSHTNTGNPSHSGTSKPPTNSGSQACSTVMANEDSTNDGDPDSGDDKDDEDDCYVSQTVIDHLEAFVGHNVAHLSNRRLKELLEALPQTQASALETQAEPSQAITEPPAGVGLARRDRHKSPSQEGLENRSPSQERRATHFAPPQKRHIDNLNPTPTTSKRVRIATAGQDDGSATEDEDDDESEIEIRMRRRNRYVDSSEPESDAEPASSKPQVPPASSQGATAPKPANPKVTPRLPSKSSGRPMPLPSPHTTSSSTNGARATLDRRSDTASHVIHPPPPSDLTDVDALVAWALGLAEEKTRALDQGRPLSIPSTSKAHSQLPNASATVDHISRAVANHRSRLNGGGPSGTQESENRASQSNQAGAPPSRAAASDDDDLPTRSSERKKREYSKKAKLSDFPGRIGEVASAAIPRFLATVFAEGAYEDPETLRSWSHDAYRETWDLEAPEDEYEPPPRAVLTIMMRRASWLRTKVRERVEVIVQYGFEFRNPAVRRSDIKHNRRLAEKLAPNVFHCKNLKPNTDQYEHEVFIRAIGAALFWDPQSIGAVYHAKFKLLPIPAVALVLTMMQVCIEEWALGQFKSQALDVEKQQVVYERHLLGLYEYERIAGGRLTRFHENWFKAGVEYSRANLDGDDDTVQPYTQGCHVRPDTPPPEVDDEPFGGVGDD
ncbi:hypothetical protein FRC08_002654 [Ceratobasidium sp. 394]|nr:hypothetical protein FRC08_002654 [Ceratobasidium sp. 394]KAG9084719.1 hypothetical protein FS749_005009 [Ceratobasidium sp. UAMH 11750]